MHQCDRCNSNHSMLHPLGSQRVCSVCWNEEQYDKREARLAAQRRKKEPNEQVAGSSA
jgi:hypothetical protein